MTIEYFAPLMLDSYKLNHHEQYPKGTTEVYSNFTARSGKHSNIPKGKGVVFFGLQLFLLDYLIEDWSNHFFNVPKSEALETYSKYSGIALNKLEHISDLHDLGYLPLHIKALPEGSFVPYGVPFVTVKNTHPDFAWLTNSIESVLSTELAPMINTITTSAEYLKKFIEYAEITGCDVSKAYYQPHNFSFRGMFFREAAIKVGLAHLAAGIKGTDTIYSNYLANEYYGSKGNIGSSIPATEHAVMCAGMQENELETIKRLILDIYPEGAISIVLDTWDLFDAIDTKLRALKDIILSRNGVLVVRPDSGNPVDIICGTYSHYDLNRMKGVVELLSDIFGYTITEKGYKLLDPHVRVIYGDSITLAVQNEILYRLSLKKFASENVYLGVGSYSFQGTTRDTHSIACKATNVVVDGIPKPIFKDPVTSEGTKTSAKGLLMVSKGINGYELHQEVTPKQENSGCLEPVFLNGNIMRYTFLSEIQQRVYEEYIK